MASHSGLRQLFRSVLLGAERRRRAAAAPRMAVELLEFRTLLTNPLTAIPRLNSLPGAPVTIYLDFDGHTETQNWPNSRTDNQSGPVVTPVFDIDNDFTTFSDTELEMIEETWYRVAEDFMPLRVNVTTVDPGTYNDFETMLVSIGGNGSWIGSPGGIAYLGAFNNGTVNTCYVFSDNVGKGGVDHVKGIAMAASHEVGHTMDLLHHSVYDAGGNKTAEYDSGRPDVGPLMGAPYGSMREIWVSAPDSNGVNSIQDDFQVLTSTRNRTVAFRADDHGNTIATATPLLVSSPDILLNGVLGQNDDIDVFRFETDSGDISFSVTGLNLRAIYGNNNLTYGTNADLVLELRDSNGNLIVRDDPATSLFASVSANVTQGVYYVLVSSTGQYGAIGQYTLAGTVIPLPSVPVMLSPTGVQSDPLPVFTWSAAGNTASYTLEVDRYNTLTKSWVNYLTTSVTTNSFTAAKQFEQLDYRARVRSVGNINGQLSAWSNYVNFTIDVPAPGTPTLLKPLGDIANSFPEFEWTTSQNAATYWLWVQNSSTGERVIYRTNFNGTKYTHFNALKDGLYTVWVRAANAVGELSPWSRPVQFNLVAPSPTAPTLLSPSSLTSSTNPRFTWTAVDGAATYDLWVNNLTTGQNQYLRKSDLPGSQTFFDPTVFTQGIYVAWLRAANANGKYGPWSPALRFTVDILPPAAPVVKGPVGLNDSKVVATVFPTFTWTAVDRAVRYELWVNNMTTGQYRIIHKTDLTTNSYTAVEKLTQGEYRVWARAFNSAGEAGEYSAMYTFTLDEPTPVIPKIIAPVANPAGSVDDANPTFVWTSVPDAPFYQIQISEVNPTTGRLTQVILQDGLTTKSFTVPFAQRLKETTYIARVRGYNNSNEFSSWSENYNFRIDVPDPLTPAITGPGGTINDSTPVFSWTHDKASFRYEILLRDLERNETIVLQVNSFQLNPAGTEAYYTLPNDKALSNGTYRFWVRGFNSMGTAGAWSDARVFVISVTQNGQPLKAKTLDALSADALLAALLPGTSQKPARATARPQQDPLPVDLPAAVNQQPAEIVVAASATETAAATAADQLLLDEAIWTLINPQQQS
jgi:hypothetical protein